MKYIVDRIENNIAVLENLKDNKIISLSLNDLKINVKEKDVLVFDGKVYSLDDNEKEKRIRKIKEKMERLKALKRKN